MKANNGKGNTILRDMWETPQELFDTLNKQYTFQLDCCATKENTKCLKWFEDFFNNKPNYKAYIYMCWMNPPFSIAWKMFDHFFKTIRKGVAIYRCDNLETGLWQKIIMPNASWIFIPNKRIPYEGLDGDGARFASALIGFNVNIPKNINGTILYLKKN